MKQYDRRSFLAGIGSNQSTEVVMIETERGLVGIGSRDRIVCSATQEGT